MTTSHATDRVRERLTEAGYSRPEQDELLAKVDKFAARTRQGRSVAVRVLRLGEQVGREYSDRSNGDEFWAIIRDRKVVTTMLRRSNQPATAAALRVDLVITR